MRFAVNVGCGAAVLMFLGVLFIVAGLDFLTKVTLQGWLAILLFSLGVAHSIWWAVRHRRRTAQRS